MSQVNQRQGVYTATMNVLADAGINFDDGQAGGVEAVVTKELRGKIISVVTTAILANEVEMSTEGRTKYSDEKKMTGYVSGLVSNWFHKDARLNGDTKYTAKNPGSRAGAGDAQLKALKAFRATQEGNADAQAQVDAAIATRKEELAAKKAPEMTQEMLALLPASLRAKLNI